MQNPNGKSLTLGRDTVGEVYQPQNSSFVYFGHDTNWYAINDLPMISLSFRNGTGARYTRRCITVGIEVELDNMPEITIYPNPSNGTFTLENATSIQTLEIYDANGQKVQVELFNNQLDLTDQPKGIYLLRVLLESGELVSKKLMKY